jgi:hypothetical protein
MTSSGEPDLRYPIGPHAWPRSYCEESRAAAIAAIEAAPANFRRVVTGLTDAQLDTAYRPGGWSVRQLVHHLADAHMVLYTRAKIALTEDNPPVKTWDEQSWAALPDSTSLPIDGSLAILDAVHARFVHLLKTLTPEQFARAMSHPDWGIVSIDGLIDICAWHGRHHTAHASELRRRRGWNPNGPQLK